jgi:hypothetical protein
VTNFRRLTPGKGTSVLNEYEARIQTPAPITHVVKKKPNSNEVLLAYCLGIWLMLYYCQSKYKTSTQNIHS